MDLLDFLLRNDFVSFGALFVVLFWWTLKTNESRECRLLGILDKYGVQLGEIADSLRAIQEQNRLIVEKLTRPRGD